MIAPDQRRAHEMDAADGKLDGAYYGKPVGVAGQRSWIVVEQCPYTGAPFVAHVLRPMAGATGLKSPGMNRRNVF